METVLLVLVGLVVGFSLAVAFLHAYLRASLEAQFEERLRQTRERATEEALRRSSATVKGQVGERFAPFVPGFGYEPADARFLGSPVDYVVFDGLSDGQIRAVAFVEVKTGHIPLTPFQKRVQEAIEGHRVRWRLVELPE